MRAQPLDGGRESLVAWCSVIDVGGRLAEPTVFFESGGVIGQDEERVAVGQRTDELGHGLEVFDAVVEAGDQQRGQLEPGIGFGFQVPAQLLRKPAH